MAPGQEGPRIGFVTTVAVRSSKNNASIDAHSSPPFDSSYFPRPVASLLSLPKQLDTPHPAFTTCNPTMLETSGHQDGSLPQSLVVNIEVCIDASTGERFIFWENIETFFLDCMFVVTI
jgi:hypothetical protein